VPSNEAVSAIDDVLSVVKNMQFYGKSTSTYKNTKDAKSGSYCTIPVKYEFKDKDIRIRAETTLREHCNVQCSTPYPTILREAIRQVISHVKTEYPGYQVKVNVDSKNFGLKVARRLNNTGDKTIKNIWHDYDKLIPLPPEVLDIGARKIPDNFKVGNLPRKPTETPMEQEQLTNSGRKSRIDTLGGATGGTPLKK